MKIKSESEVSQSCPILSDPMDCSLPGSSAHGIFQARVLEWSVIAFSDKKTIDYLSLCELFIAKWTYSIQKFVNYKLALAKGICYLPLRRLNPVLMQLLTFHTPWRELSMENGALRAPGKLEEQVFQFSSVTQLCLTLRPDGLRHAVFPAHHQLLEIAQTHVYWVGDVIQPSHSLSSPFPPAFNLSQHQGLS